VTDLSLHIRPELARPSPYRWQEGIPEGHADRFDMNTGPDAPAWYASELARLAAIPPQDYPEATYAPVRRAIAGYTGVAPEQVVVGAGCDEILVLCALLALGRGDTAVVAQPTYQVYAVASRNAGAQVHAIPPLEGTLRLDWDAVERAAPSARVVWLCSPNNPTAEEADPERVAAICRTCPGIVVVDQAYGEYDARSFQPLLADHGNLLVAGTFSKAFALAGARVGYALAQLPLAGALDALRPPGSLSSWAVALAEIACTQVPEMQARVGETIAERAYLAAGLDRAGVQVLAQGGNYLLARMPVPDLFARLAEQRLVVRTFAHEPLLSHAFRITVQDRLANDRLLRALAEVAGGEAPEAPAPPSGRRAAQRRVTKETSIAIDLSLDGTGRSSVRTGLGFLDHMLTALAFWGMLDLDLSCSGDLWVDEHHTVEDCAIAIGEAIDAALGDRAGLRRFADASAPLDEALAHATLDLSGRGVARIELGLGDDRVGQVPASLFPHFFDTLARRGRLGLHLRAEGEDDHHRVEAAFKATALALRSAVTRDPERAGVASTKGLL
jgi:histidinol-phosphate aminotransferase